MLGNSTRKVLRTFRIAGKAKSPQWLLHTLLGKRSHVQVRVFGTPITVRTSSPDLKVAVSCLGAEFDSLCSATPALEHNLIIDAGGYIGTAAISFSKRYPQAKVITLEPSAENYQLLVKNTAGFPNIIPLNKALAPEPGVLTLHDRGTGEWGFTLVGNAADRQTKVVSEVECITVQQIMEMVGASGIDIFKIDIEGGEHALLSRNTEWIDATRSLCIELHDRIVPRCSEAWNAAVAGRKNFKLKGEKYVSVRLRSANQGDSFSALSRGVARKLELRSPPGP